MNKNQQGIVHLVVVVLIAVVVAAVGFAGYRVMQNDKTKTTSSTDTVATSSGTEVAASKPEWTEAGIAVAGTFADADVLKINDKQWRMYYAIQPEVQGHHFEVYSATSGDGKTWTQEPGTRKTMATFPDVVKLKDGKYRMYYQSAGVINSAISTDGLNFTNEAGTRIDKINTVNMNLDNVAAPTVMLQDDGTYVMVYRGTINTRYAQNTPNPTTQVLLWATSTDGLIFTKKGLAVDSRNETLNGQLDGPDLIKWDSSTKLFATTYTGVYEFSFDGKTFGKPTLAFAGEAKKDTMGFHGSPPGDPTVIKINGTWHMFYGGPKTKNGINSATYIDAN